MKKLSLVAALVILSASSAFAASKTYQVTGPVTDITDSTVTVKKGSESWEISKGDVKFPDTIKKDSKITVYYTMTANKVEDKSPAPKADKKADEKHDAKATDAKATDAKADAKTDKKAK